MSDCVAKDRTSRVRLFVLDACGRMSAVAGVSVLDVDNFETISWAENVTAGDQNTTSTTSGAVCRNRRAAPTDLGQNVSLNECIASWTLSAIMGYGTLVPVSTVLKGINRTALNPNAKLAMEIIFPLDVNVCVGGVAQCVSRLYPLLQNATISGDSTIDGKVQAKASYTLETAVNPNLFQNYATPGTPTGEMAHWNSFKADVNAGASFYFERILDCPTLAGAVSCELRALI